MQGTAKFFEQFGEKLPAQLSVELLQLEARLKNAEGVALKI